METRELSVQWELAPYQWATQDRWIGMYIKTVQTDSRNREVCWLCANLPQTSFKGSTVCLSTAAKL